MYTVTQKKKWVKRLGGVEKAQSKNCVIVESFSNTNEWTDVEEVVTKKLL